VIDEAESKRVKHSSLDVQVVGHLDDILAAIIQRAVAENETVAAEFDVQ
jgi:hypothetical protein